MSEVRLSRDFLRSYKRLRKKYKSLAYLVPELLNSLSEHPTQGVEFKPNAYKIRLAIPEKNKGKSGGARIITFLEVVNDCVFVLEMYDKSEMASIPDHEIEAYIMRALEEETEE